MIGRSKEEIARDLREQAEKNYGPERAEALRGAIEDTARNLSLIMGQALPIDGDEPDFLVAPATKEGN